MKPLVLTHHALVERIRVYGLSMADVERAVYAPDWTEPEPGRPEVERRFIARASTGRRALRVAVVEEADHIRVLSAHPDRNARPPMPVDMTYDPEADAVFIRLAETEKPYEGAEVSPGVVIDFTEDGRVTGIEIMPASRLLAPGAWSRARPPSLPTEVIAAE